VYATYTIKQTGKVRRISCLIHEEVFGERKYKNKNQFKVMSYIHISPTF